MHGAIAGSWLTDSNLILRATYRGSSQSALDMFDDLDGFFAAFLVQQTD